MRKRRHLVELLSRNKQLVLQSCHLLYCLNLILKTLIFLASIFLKLENLFLNKFFFSINGTNTQQDAKNVAIEPAKKDENKENDIETINIDTNKMMKDLENFLKDGKVVDEKVEIIPEEAPKTDRKSGKI